MPNFNKVLLIGNLTRDPQLSYMPNETAVCEIGLAVNRRYTVSGEKKEETCFIDCRCYGKQAETLNKYTHKGAPILIEGRLQFDQWEKDGERRSKHRVVIEGFQFMGAKPKSTPPPQPVAAETHTPPGYLVPRDDDIPF